MAVEFQGTGLALSSDGLARVCGDLGVHAAELWAVLAVETKGCGYIADRRPQILYERHVFHRLTNGKHDDGDISSAAPGGYGSIGRHQFDRLGAAIAKDRAAALKSASWGLGQIMGENFAAAGHKSVGAMVSAMCKSEDDQLAAMGKFLISRKLHGALQAHDWASFARGYNGPAYAKNSYDVRLKAEFQKFSAGVLPDLSVRAAQLYLTYLGFHPGDVDGVPGKQTVSALAMFQEKQRLPLSETIDESTVAQLVKAMSPRAAAAGLR